jgi:non-canonical purine NTP pyrophosphatase (RdgB/HAM1 family)
LSRTRITTLLITAAVSGVAIAPFLYWGTPSGHDFEFHMFSWMDVVRQWHQGVVYPRWAALAHWGYGEPTFVFYPPASWTFGASLGAILPWTAVPGIYCWIVLTLSGTTMYTLARRWLPQNEALFAAVFYAANPYHLLIVYWRSAFAELLAAALLPLVLLEIVRTKDDGFRPALGLSLVLAAAWLTNLPAAVMIHYSAALLALALSLWERSSRPLQRTALAILIGAGLASFYLIPAIYEQRWVNIAEVLSPGVRPQDNFLFTTILDPDHNRFNLLVSFVALAEIGALAAAAVVSFRRTAIKSSWMLLTTWGATTAFVMTSASNLLWKHLPKFRFVQLPFRWLLCLNAALAMLLSMALPSPKRSGWLTRVGVFGILVLVLVFAGQKAQPPWWDTAADIHEMSDAVSDGTGYEGVDEYVPAGADPYELNQKQAPVTNAEGLPVNVRMAAWNAIHKNFRVHLDAPENLTLRLFNYPAWTLTVNGQPVRAGTTEITHLLVVPVPAGETDVQVEFSRTHDRTAGDLISLLSLGLFLIAWRKTKPGSKAKSDFGRVVPQTVLVATSNPGKLRDFMGAAGHYGITIGGIPGFSSLTPVVEDGTTFEENARKKAGQYSRAVPGQLVLADDSGLEVDALQGAPGVHSARYAAEVPQTANSNTDDEANNARVLRELADVREQARTARFVCVLAAARDGQILKTFRGAAEGVILDTPRGTNGFGYDPLFYFPEIGKTFAELSAEEKSRYSHRGAAFRAFLEWCARQNLTSSG